MDGTELVAAVRRGDAEAVRARLESGAAPDTVTDDGLPVLCLALTAFDAGVAQALVEGGADPDRLLPDGTTPLVRAVEGGSPAMVEAVLGREPRLRLPEADGSDCWPWPGACTSRAPRTNSGAVRARPAPPTGSGCSTTSTTTWSS
ncbi:ankyrin repeat domain-containing protein [Streptomyces sp. NBC_00443]|uniref:ankyrin repeat domain-containing protein n=1 Tax=Streptomyces sp. NBC_00443 TaxID=2975743 RepID=UPI002E1D5BD9